MRGKGKAWVATAILAGFLALAGWAMPALAAARGLSAVALNAVSGLPGLKPASSHLLLSGEPTLIRSAPSLYSRVAELAERYRVIPVEGATGGELVAHRPTGQTFWPRLAVPEVSLPAQESQPDSAELAEVAGVRLAGRLVPPEEVLSGQEGAATDEPQPAVDLVATVPLVPERLDVSAHYRLVDVDRLAGASVNSTAQTMGVGGQVSLNGGTVLKAGYEVTRQGSSLTSTRTDAGLTVRLDSRTDLSAGLRLDHDAADGPQVRTTVGLGYRLNNDTALQASYTLINFGTRPSPAQGSHQASAELSLRF
ncbi:MAG: hypothetical protein ACM3XZ_08520 [Betaproteobacteria bacterium]